MQPASRLTYRFAQESNNEPMQHHADLPLRERVRRYFQSSQWYPAKVHRTHNTFHENRIVNAGGIKRSSCKSKSEPQPKLGTQNFRHRRMRITKINFPKDSQLSFAAIKLRKKKPLCFLLRYRPVWCSKSPVAVRVTKLCLYCFKHFSHSSTKLFPCNSAKDSLGKPDLQCKSSTFVVATNLIKPLQYNRAMAMCAELGCNDLFNSKSSLTVSPFNFLVQTPRGPRWN